MKYGKGGHEIKENHTKISEKKGDIKLVRKINYKEFYTISTQFSTGINLLEIERKTGIVP